MPQYEKSLGTFSVDRDDVQVRLRKTSDGVRMVEVLAYDEVANLKIAAEYPWGDIAGFAAAMGPAALLALAHFKADKGLTEV